VNRLLVAFAAIAASEAPAHADDAAALVSQGEALGKQGEFTRAIQLFKQADAQQPTAANACRIGLAYTRREAWSQAEIFFALCEKRATATDPTPDWLPTAKVQLQQKLEGADAAAIDVRVEPVLATARVRITSFPPDEAFEPSAIHLAPGTYEIVASAPGREPAHASLTVVPRTAEIVTLVLAEPPPPPPPPPTRAHRVGTWLLYGAAGAAAVGLGFHALAYDQRNTLQTAQAAHDPVTWDHHASTFEHERDAAIGSYAVAATAGTVR
jgi:hypothetical protein